jgi:CheY-like chemotaxis protein
MDEDTRRRCFEPFFTTKGERGTGLGLAMVHGVARRHGAEIEIESAPGRGTNVRMSFRVPAAAAAEVGKAAGAHYAVPSRLRLLVVDDDPLLLKSLRDTLEGDGHVVTVAGDGRSGVDLFRAALERGEGFAVVITDLGMPYMDGRRVAAAIKGASPATPIILLTGWGQRLMSDKDIPPHVDHILSKPPKLRELRDTLVQCCQRAGS